MTCGSMFLEIEIFLYICFRMFERGDGENGMVQCRHLLSAPSDLVRSGDIFSVMIEHATKTGDWKTAVQLAQELKRTQPHDSFALYIPKGNNKFDNLDLSYEHYM